MRYYTVLPVRFCTIAEDEAKVKRILEIEHDRFVDSLRNMEGKKELGLKAIFKEDVIYKDILEKYKDIKVLKEKIAALPSEKTYLQRAKIGEMVEAALEKEKAECKEDILNILSPLAVEVKTNNTYGELMIISAAFLVQKTKNQSLTKRLRNSIQNSAIE